MPIRQFLTKDQMTETLNNIGHRTAFHNDQTPNHIVKITRFQNDNNLNELN